MQRLRESHVAAQLKVHNSVHRCRPMVSEKEISMFKQRLLVLVAAGAIAIATPFVAAQDSPSNDQAAPNAMQGNGGWQHHQMDPAQRTQHLTKQLKLTSDQQAKVQDILT